MATHAVHTREVAGSIPAPATIPALAEHDGALVVRDDFYPGGTKARFIGAFFSGAEEAVCASPAEGGVQPALATVVR